MKLTKYNHACVVLEKDNELLIIDPGSFTELPEDLLSTCAIIITHIHPDHLSKDNLRKILDINPEAKIFAPGQVVNELTEFQTAEAVGAGQKASIGPFELEFFGGDHALIHESLPYFDNIGVLVNEKVYYPGDSFVAPSDTKPSVLLVPASAPWLKISEAMDFIAAVEAKTVIPTHDALLSEIGVPLHDNWLAKATESYGGTYKRLRNKETLGL